MTGRRQRLRRAASCAALAWLLLAGSSGPGRAQDRFEQERLAQIQSAFLLNFARYATWPPEVFQSADSRLIVTVLGQPRLLPYLRQIVRGEVANGRSIEIRQLDYPADYAAREPFREALLGSHMVFIDAADGEHAPWVLRMLDGADVLTVGASRRFVDHGGMLELRRRHDRVTFAANVGAIAATRIQVSSKVLSLAEWIERAN